MHILLILTMSGSEASEPPCGVRIDANSPIVENGGVVIEDSIHTAHLERPPTHGGKRAAS